MNKKLFAAALAVALTITIGGCARTAPILNLENVPVASNDGKALSAAQVRASIVTAGTSLGWKIVDAGPGRLEGTLVLREHTAVVTIPYSAKSYSIIYKASDKLNEANGTIHSNYNGWVQNLDRTIKTELTRL